MTTIIRRFGRNMVVIIPDAMAREMGLTAGTRLYPRVTATGILLQKRRGRSMREIVSQISPRAYRRHIRELSKGDPGGKEI